MSIEISKVIRTKRKTIALQITDDATLVVRAPFGVSDEIIKKVVEKHKSWIEKKIREVRARDPKVAKKEFVNGEGFLYLGKYYKLHIVDKQDVPLMFNNGFFLLKSYVPVARELFVKWYKKMAYEKISERVEWYAGARGFKYNKVNITDAQKRWGSCSSCGNLNFSWRLIMAPLPVVDYVVVHELAHLEERNHGEKFWAIVKMLFAEYERYQDWLKANGYMLTL
jgi:hypothetical protein